MADLKIPNLNKNYEKFIFKKKLSLRRKSRRKLLKESLVMLSFCVLIIYINFLIPNKISILNNFLYNFKKLIANLFNSLPFVYEISLAIFIMLSLIFALFLVLGSFSRILKILKRKTMRIKFK